MRRCADVWQCRRQTPSSAPCRLLGLLQVRGVFVLADLAPLQRIAALSVDELPRCALLAEYLPGPAQCAAELARAGGPFAAGQGDALNLHADARAPLGAPPPAAAASGRGGAGRPSAPRAGLRVDAAARAAAGLLHSRFERLCPALDYQAVVAAAREQARSGPAVVHAAHARMHVAAVSDVHVVSFEPCRGAAAPAAAAEVSRPLQERQPLRAVGTSCTACKQTDAPV